MTKPASKRPQPTKDAQTIAAAAAIFSPATAKAWQNVMLESTRFMTARLQQDLEIQKAILNCKTPAELIKLQTEFFQTAMQQYSEETMRLLKMMSDVTEETASEATAGASREYDDIPL